ncbi:spore germination protein [Bacillus alkalicellulosilyticus]|uniref:spore germination protein n=1 Tax=Alkalihalobacterium alkalicellulosilyticum TaxID=1912214 RepID=UPI001482992F|nr:spore germination protein [Bacillus alkalicellulosilyticus]
MLRKKMRQKQQQTKNNEYVTPNYEDFLKQKIGITNLEEIPTSTEKVSSILETVFEHSIDFEERNINIPSGQKLTIYFFNSIINHERLQEGVVTPFISRIEHHKTEFISELGEVIYNIQYDTPTNWKDLIQNCLKGDVICHLSGIKPITIPLVQFEKRNLSEPTTEQQVYGPKVGFIEDSLANLSIVRKYFQDPRLKAQKFLLGSLSKTKTYLVYLDEYVDNDLLNDVVKKMSDIKTDNIITTMNLAQHLVEFPKSLFPQVKKTERPDQVAFALTQGKIVIFLDNSTFAIILPTTLWMFYETGDDNDEGSMWNLTFMRLLRISSMFIATLAPATYVALVAFHPELIPTTLALTVAESRNNIPFPAPAEAFLMMFALDVLVEASIRLPSFIGQTIGIVGGLVIGQSAVEAGIVSSAMVIVIAFTAISAFTAPSWELASSWRVIRYMLLFFAAFLGLYGLILGICLFTMHTSALTSFKKPYMSSLSPLNPREFFDVFVRNAIRKNDKGGNSNENSSKDA